MKSFIFTLLFLIVSLSIQAQTIGISYKNRLAAGFSFFFATNTGVPGAAYHTEFSHAFSKTFGGNLAISGLTGSSSDGTPFTYYNSYSSLLADAGVFVQPVGKRLRIGTGLSYQYGNETYASFVREREIFTGEGYLERDEDFTNERLNRPGFYIKGEVFLFHTERISTAIALNVYTYFVRGYFGEIFTVGFHTGYHF